MITLLEQAREYKMFRPIWKNLLEVPVLLGVITPMILIGIYATYSFFANFELANVFYFLTGYFIFNVLSVKDKCYSINFMSDNIFFFVI